MKYIDTDKLKAEIDRQEKQCPLDTYEGRHKLFILGELKTFLSTLEESERPEPYNPVYDETYLNEKIKKASKTWKGVDVDKYMNEVRGREPEVDLEKAAENYIAPIENDEGLDYINFNGRDIKDAFIAGAEWMESQFEHCGSFPVEDPMGGYWPTDYYIKKK